MEGSIDRLDAWIPQQRLRTFSEEIARYSSGFLRCKPERWFPNLGAQWLPLAISLGTDLRVMEASPHTIAAISNIGTVFEGIYCGEAVGIAFDKDSEQLIEDRVISGANGARGLVLEYMARRLFSSLAVSWRGPQGDIDARFRGVSGLDSNRFVANQAGAVKIVVASEGAIFPVWILLGTTLLNQLDELWRKQIRSTSRVPKEGAVVQVEIAQVGIPTEEVENYLLSGAIIELEAPATDAVTLRVGGKAWLTARACLAGEYLAVEMSSKAASDSEQGEGLDTLAVRFCDFSVDGGPLAECSQPGAILSTGIKAENKVFLFLNGKAVGTGLLFVYENGLAVVVN